MMTMGQVMNEMITPELLKKISAVQAKVVVKKTKYNAHGKYHYRDLESILTALAPLLREQGLIMWMSDEVCEIGGVVHLVAHVNITDGEGTLTVDGWAQEASSQAGMAPAQISGACSSYARKYALNGLFLLDDVDDDGIETTQKPTESPRTGEFDALCTTCGKGYHFKDSGQYNGFLARLKEQPCCDNPVWRVL